MTSLADAAEPPKSPQWFVVPADKKAGETIIGPAPCANWEGINYLLDIEDNLLRNPALTMTMSFEWSDDGWKTWKTTSGTIKGAAKQAGDKASIPGGFTGGRFSSNCVGRIKVNSNLPLKYGGAAKSVK